MIARNRSPQQATRQHARETKRLGIEPVAWEDQVAAACELCFGMRGMNSVPDVWIGVVGDNRYPVRQSEAE